MELPVFYAGDMAPGAAAYTMDEPTSKYCVTVLRKTKGDKILLADGRGGKFTAEITDDHRKKCVSAIIGSEQVPAPAPRLRIGIAFTKNASRMEWFLEKATEIGMSEIIPLVTRRTEKEHLKMERLESILVSAMLQSRQWHLPKLHTPQPFESLMATAGQRFIAHCLPGEKKSIFQIARPAEDALLLIGPEGDFTPEEVALSLQNGYLPVTLGNTRLRTETAGLVGCTLLAAVNNG
ncbi:RsmE family RNA methyltransferase [Chitinophaga rhizosphaerae]|uniref:RsmE family RNA methyltransferase n=1 Tax=Chitinophaga rhizosphaerae TaxID=1864947 RepID=UPI000F8016F4|nr:RsmE family RNA methyltransferase [Chitinophaga rhizosphaerae]